MVYVLIFAGAVLVTGMYACCVVAKQADEQMERMWKNRERQPIDKEKTFEALKTLDRVPVEDVPRWTLASDGEPTEDGDYLVVDPECCYYVATYYTTDGTEEYGWKQFRGWQDCPQVLAWMPLPAFHGFSEEVESE